MSTSAAGLDDLGGAEPPSDDLIAAEHVLGVLGAPARAAAEARVLSDAAFADRVAAWERRLAPLALELVPVDVPSRVWSAVRARLGWTVEQSPRPGLWQSVSFWRIAAGLAATAALVLLAVDFAPRPAPPAVPEAQATKAVTTLERDDGRTGWLATVDPRHGTVLMVPVPRAPDVEGRAAELWLIPPGQAPRSLGAVSLTRAHTVEVPAALRADLTDRSVLAITLEPPTGIPHAAPTGPIIAKGAIRL
ncbi:MAG TPA: anti-sigma factor [Steroidobacteraceae bacterium]|nr:anti-sigma factor [Steroidobacteraceae bacterium]